MTCKHVFSALSTKNHCFYAKNNENLENFMLATKSKSNCVL